MIPLSPAAGGPPLEQLRAVRIGHRHVLRRWLLVALLALVFGAGGLLMLSLTGTRAGVTGTALGLLLSAVVIGIVVPVFVWLDRFEAEPIGMLAFAFGWGACVATIGSLVLGDIGGYLLGATHRTDALVTVVVTPVVEESLKGLAPLLLLWFRRREIDGILDGMVYAGLAGCGFAFVENIVYLADGYANAGEQGLMGSFVVRVLMSPFAHPMFSLCLGIGVGVAAVSRSWRVRLLSTVGGWACAVALHALWNAAAMASDDGWLWFYVVVQLPLFIGFAAVLLWARRREQRTITEHLRAYAGAGWLNEAEVAMLSSIPERRYARQWVRSHDGKAAEARMVRFQDAAAEVALHRSKIVRGRTSPANLHREQRLLATIWNLRTEFEGTAIYRRYEVLGHL